MPLPPTACTHHAPAQHAPARLDSALAGLCRVRIAHAPLAVVVLDVLDRIAQAVSADACSVVLRARGEDDLVRASDVAVGALTAAGVSEPGSPLATALTSGDTVNIASVTTGSVGVAWPTPGQLPDGVAVRSVVARGITVDDDTRALVAYWSATTGAFTAEDETAVAALATHVAPVLANAVTAHDLLRRNENLTRALTSRAVIDQAIGIVMSRTGSTAEQALDRMRLVSRREHVKVHEVAQRTVDDAVNRSRTRRPRTNNASG